MEMFCWVFLHVTWLQKDGEHLHCKSFVWNIRRLNLRQAILEKLSMEWDSLQSRTALKLFFFLKKLRNRLWTKKKSLETTSWSTSTLILSRLNSNSRISVCGCVNGRWLLGSFCISIKDTCCYQIIFWNSVDCKSELFYGKVGAFNFLSLVLDW